MANIRIDYPNPIVFGMHLEFAAPCDCSAVSGITVYYPNDSGITISKTFVFKDAHQNTLTSIGNLFSRGAIISVLLDTENAYAYIQNADTNKYLEDQLSNRLLKSGGVMTGRVKLNGITLTEGVDYGDELPAPGIPGRIFFKRVR